MILWALDMLAQVSSKEILENGAEEGSNTPWMMLCAGIALIALVLLRLAGKRLAANRAREGLSVTERVELQRQKQEKQNGGSSRREQRQFTDRINELMAELAELSRQINGQLETRLTQLEVTLGEADEKIRRLEELNGEEGPGDGASKQDAREGEDVAEATGRPEMTATAEEDGNAGAEVHPLLLTGENRAVIELAEGGRSSREIAQETGRPIGEIELILSLGGKKSGD